MVPILSCLYSCMIINCNIRLYFYKWITLNRPSTMFLLHSTEVCIISFTKEAIKLLYGRDIIRLLRDGGA